MKTFLKEVLLPLLIALCLAAFFKPVYMADGVCDYFLIVALRRLPVRHPQDVPLARSFRVRHIWHGRNLRTQHHHRGLIGGLALIVGLLLGIIHTIREII